MAMLINNATIGIIYHPEILAAESLAHKLESYLPASGVSVWICSSWNEEKAQEQIIGTTLLLSIGGDGTILKAARIAVPWSIPIVGINLGKLGFMTELNAKEAIEKIPLLISGDGWIDERAMLQAELITGKSQPSVFHALNDVVVSRGSKSRVIYVKTYIDNAPLTTYKADGVIAATATGSTGYSLSAGGPILHPRAKEIILLPVSAHLTLSTPLILSPAATIELHVESDHQAILSIDGQIEVPLESGNIIKISRSQHTAHFRRLQPANLFYQTLLHRLSARSNI